MKILLSLAQRSASTVFLSLLVIAPVGCGGGVEGPPKYNLSGTVVYKGQPVPNGTITLMPDHSQGNSGPSVNLPIADGKYNSDLVERGVIAGELLVMIEGLEKEDPNKEVAAQLFTPHEMSFTMPESDTVHDFVVPE